MSRLRIYLAGPEVFLPDAVSIGADKKRLCDEFGFEGLFPFDNEDPSSDAEIYKANLEMIRSADMGIFNLTPFRGVSADVGTVFELGLFIGHGKPVFGYSNDDRRLLERVGKGYSLSYSDRRETWVDEFDMSVENFGNVDNLMIDCAFARQGLRIHVSAGGDRYRDLTGLVACLEDAHRHARQVPQRERASA